MILNYCTMDFRGIGVALVAVFVVTVFLLPLIRLQIDYFQRLSRAVIESGGTLQIKYFWMRGPSVVVTGDPANVEYIAKERFDSFPKGETFKHTLHDVFGDGLFCSDNELWRNNRMCFSKSFNYSNFRDKMMLTVVEMVNGRLLPLLEDACKRGLRIDFEDVLCRLSFDSTCIAGFGMDPGFLCQGLPEAPFIEAFHEAMKACMSRLELPLWYWKAMKLFGVGSERRLRKAQRVVEEFVREIIQKMRAGSSSRENDSLITMIVQLQQGTGLKSLEAEELIRNHVIDIVLAAADTTPVGLTWFLWLLHEHPRVEDKIVQEIERVLAHRRRFATTANLKVDDVKGMHYLHAALSESMRLYPPVSLNGRMAVEDEALPDGRTHVTKGTKILCFTYCMGRMEAVWGKDCLEFKPERWLRDGVFVNESEFKFPVFSAGPRRCLGKDIAYSQMKYVAASILQRYRLAVVPGHTAQPDEHGITLSMKRGLPVIVRPRDDQVQTEQLPC